MKFDAIDIAKRAKLEIDVPWDDVRAARVHKKAVAEFAAEHADDREGEAQHDEESGEDDTPASKITLPKTRPSRLTWLVAIVAIAAAVALFVQLRRPQGELASTVQFSDGSRSLLSAQAQVHVIEDTESHVHVRQRTGSVRYDIMPRPERAFVVSVEGVTITVLGTIFDVSVDGERVEVSVERGRVRVETRGRTVELTAGEHASLRRDGSAFSDATETDATVDSPDAPQAEPVEKADVAPAPTASQRAPEAAASAAPEAQPTAAEWLRRADSARAAGNLDAALSALHALIAAYPTDARATLALFTIGKVERQRGNHARAAQAFEQCGAALNGDAIAEAASSWQAAGQGAAASAAAKRYLQTYPEGVHAASMRSLSGGD